MDHKLMCKYLNIADSYFKGENADTKIINKDPAIKGFCNNGVCETNEAGINALVAYIFNQFKRSIESNEYNKYDEYLLMWLSDKLFKIHDKSKDKDNEITLNQAYDTYLKNHKVNFNYWNFFYNIESLKESNLWYMSEFYKLLDKICKTITDYEKNRDEITNLITNSTECSNQYISIYNDIHKCQSYLDLLNKLKGIYDDFRNYAIQATDSNNNLETDLKKLTKPDGEEMDAVKGFKSYNFSNSECKVKKKSVSLKKEDSPPLAPSPEQPKDQLSEQKDSDGSDNDRDGTDSDPVEDGSQSTEGDPFNTGPLILSVSFQGVEKLNDAITSFGTIKKRITECTDTIKNLYSTSLTNLEDNYNKYSSFLKEMIDNISTDSKQVEPPSESGGGGDDPSQPQKDSEQTSSETSPSSTEENKTNQSSQEPSGSQNSDKSDQGGPEKPVEGPVIKPEHPGSGVKGNGTIGIGDIFIFKEYKKIGIPIIVIIISITLAIMYKFLVFDRRKKLKRKKMKKVPNLFGVNKTT
ncbi:CIR protein [Plasmodium chabaudi adami]|uniref:CIR protein n=1 Tax=Plasmodium chabaudi adami TaxID=5826 RepID=A0A1C6X0X1_PLACE|nr:CIR protein [Plasmodium chabaudi adami]